MYTYIYIYDIFPLCFKEIVAFSSSFIDSLVIDADVHKSNDDRQVSVTVALTSSSRSFFIAFFYLFCFTFSKANIVRSL